jgi:hypothetical protein
MKRRSSNALLPFPIVMLLILFVSCGPAPSGPAPAFPLTNTTLTAAMGSTLEALPSNTPPAGVTFVPRAGDLGWGAVYGRIADGTSGLPLDGATVRCEHSSYTSPSLCSGVTTTNADGNYIFTPVFFHDTDRITLIVEAPGFTLLRFEQDFFTRPELHADLGLFPADYLTSTPSPSAVCAGMSVDSNCLTATPTP